MRRGWYAQSNRNACSITDDRLPERLSAQAMRRVDKDAWRHCVLSKAEGRGHSGKKLLRHLI